MKYSALNLLSFDIKYDRVCQVFTDFNPPVTFDPPYPWIWWMPAGLSILGVFYRT